MSDLNGPDHTYAIESKRVEAGYFPGRPLGLTSVTSRKSPGHRTRHLVATDFGAANPEASLFCDSIVTVLLLQGLES